MSLGLREYHQKYSDMLIEYTILSKITIAQTPSPWVAVEKSAYILI